MRVLLWTYDTRGGIEPLVGLAVQLRALGAEARVCAPPDEEFAERAAGFGVPLVPFGDSLRAMATAATPSEADLRRHVDELIAAQFDTVAAAAEGCDALVATGFLATAAGARSATEKLGIHYVYASYHPTHLPSPHHPPPALAGRPFPPGLIDNRVLWDLDARNANALFGPTLNSHRASIGLPPVDNVRDHAFTDHPWLAADPALGPWQEPADLDVVQTGAWLLPDERPLPAELLAFLDAGTPPVYVGFGSMPLGASKDIARVAIEAIRAQGRRALLAHGWADLALIDDRDDCFAVGEVNHQALFGRVAAVVHHGGAGTTTTAARAGAPQVVVPQVADQPYWAARVADLGIGTAHAGPIPTIESLSAALTTALTPETRARASAVAGTIRTDGATVAATLLLDALSRERPPVVRVKHAGSSSPAGCRSLGGPQLEEVPGVTINNPYWEAVKDCVETDSRLAGNPVVGYFSLDRTLEESMARSPNRARLVRKYCWAVPDPDTVAFVAKHAQGGLVDPIAGTGYWAYLLAQVGVDVVCYDLNPGTPLLTNGWHGEDLYAEICAKDCAEAAALHPDRTLFLSWPPHGQDVGARILMAYKGRRVIYIGEGHGGATGDDQMHLILDTDWTEVDSRLPVQWWGQHDRVTVYERGA